MMMAELHYRDILNEDKINSIARNYGFKYPIYVEKFIMNFEVFSHVREMMPDCVVKGGMAVPFHLDDETQRRLSIDIDIVVGRSRDEVIEIMKNISKKLGEMIKIDQYVPKNTYEKKLPLLTYDCKYGSVFNDSASMKFEIFYENDMETKSRKIEAGTNMMGFKIDFPMSIYDPGSLIGNKLTTLPFNTVGIGPKRRIDVIRQIYDIATLLKSTASFPPMETITNMFKKTSLEEISYFNENPPTFEDVLHDIVNFPDNILIMDAQIRMDKSHKGRLRTFVADMLGNRNYTNQTYTVDILLTKAAIKLVLKSFDGTDMETITKKTKETLDGLDDLSKLDDKKSHEHKNLMLKRGKNTAGMEGWSPKQVYLYTRMAEMDEI